ncbi:MAG: hypothetical protein K2L97_08520 [Muribaculaceae bacterium]|nr:hypothetical protein [Muribaculaceae bacterium]
MGFFDSIKKAMGFSDADNDELEVDGIDATVTPIRQRVHMSAPQNVASDRSADNAGSPERRETPEIAVARDVEVSEGADVSMIFEGVVRIFNEALPAFLSDSVDPGRQRKLLYDSLDSSVKQYFDRLEKNVERKVSIRYQSESNRLHEQIEELRIKARKEEEGNSNARNLQLSAERQKRALSERVHELEKQLATIEAENEQFILENKSMANKLRLASMADSDIDESCQEILNRESQLTAREEAIKVKEENLEKRLSELESLEVARIAQIEAGSARETADKAETDDRIAHLEAEIASLKEALLQAAAKDELSQAMVNDLNSRAAKARQTAADKTQEAETLRCKLDASIDQVNQLTSKLSKAQEDLKVVREVQSQVEQLEARQRAGEAENRRQKDELMEKDELLRAKDSDLLAKNTSLRFKDETIRRLEDQADSLRKAVEAAQFEKAQTESALRSEIERLRSLNGGPVETIVESKVESEAAVEIEIPVAEDDNSIDLTLDLPELVTPEGASITSPRPRRGRPPKPRKPVEDEIPEKKQPDKKKTDEEDNPALAGLDVTDWLIATPPAEAATAKPKRQRKPKNDTGDDAFGYKEPVRQEPPDNPAQMLLW